MSDDCAICQENQNSDVRSHTLECGHRFHIKCLLTHFRIDGRCPVCRAEPESGNAHIPEPSFQFLTVNPDTIGELGNAQNQIRHLKMELSLYRHIGWFISTWCYQHRSTQDKMLFRLAHTARGLQFHYDENAHELDSDDERAEPAPFTEPVGL